MAISDRGRRTIPTSLSPEQLYQDFGPLTDTEVRHLARMRRTERIRYLHSIYSSKGSLYARMQFESLREKLGV